MGYSTEFTGQFKFDGEPPLAVVKKLNWLADQDTRDLKDGIKYPGAYCQWAITKNLDGLEWDQGEKFYYYVEWLQWIIDNILKPAGVKFSG